MLLFVDNNIMGLFLLSTKEHTASLGRLNMFLGLNQYSMIKLLHVSAYSDKKPDILHDYLGNVRNVTIQWDRQLVKWHLTCDMSIGIFIGGNIYLQNNP